MDSSRILLRIPRPLHKTLKRDALASGISVNEHCRRILSGESSRAIELGGVLLPGLSEAVRRIAQHFGTRLSGIVLFGSTARGSRTEKSDIDLLLCMGEGVSISRSLYTEWDEQIYERRDPLWKLLTPQFVASPSDPQKVGGIWLEACLDGIVLFDRNFQTAAMLGKIRWEIINGTFQARTSRGVRYWLRVKEAA